MNHPITVGLLLGSAVALTLLCCIGVLVMREAMLRLHHTAPVVFVGAMLIVIAVWVDEADWQARIKVALVGLILFWMNAVLTNATAKAIRIHQVGHWEPAAGEAIEVTDTRGPVRSADHDH